jgi:hypothetical protein
MFGRIQYVTCLAGDHGICSCGHEHLLIAEAMQCLVSDGGSFIRAHDAGAFRTLTNGEFLDFLEALGKMPWSRRYGAQGGALAVSAAVSA